MGLNSRQQLTDEQNLLAKLMYNYDKSTRPVFNASHPVNVKIGITLNQIFDVVSSMLLLALTWHNVDKKTLFVALL